LIDSSEVFTAHVDAWQTQGRLREPFGGSAARFEGWRLMASGLPAAHLNAGFVTDPAIADLSQAQAWYRSRNLPWSALAPSGSSWPHGRFLLTNRLMAVPPEGFSQPPEPAGLVIRKADSSKGDVEQVIMIDASAYNTSSHMGRRWIEPHFGFEEMEIAIAELDEIPVATGYALRCDGDAGPTVYLGGIAVLPSARRRGIASALSSWLIAGGFERGARLAHLQTGSEEAARVYERLGFEECSGVDIYVEL